MNNWISALSLDELKFFAPALLVYDDDPEEVAAFMYREGWHRPIASSGKNEKLIQKLEEELKSRPPKKYWKQVKKEIFVLICENDPKYKELRKKLSIQSEKGTSVLVTTISASIGSTMGVEAGIISGFCALALHAALKVGIESYCACSK